jgi:hypothetical protein
VLGLVLRLADRRRDRRGPRDRGRAGDAPGVRAPWAAWPLALRVAALTAAAAAGWLLAALVR